MSFEVRGLLEGFYDRLWTWSERHRVAERAAELGFDTYVYAPKEDRLQNAGWRTPYPPEEAANLASFADRCRAWGLEPWIGMRPVGISYADDTDLAILVEKLRAAVGMGAARIFLLADDIPATLEGSGANRFATLADAHVWLVERVVEALDGVPLAFTPTDYHGSGSDYLDRLGSALPVEVDLCWTGSEVCSSRITDAEAEAIGAVLRRRPLIWDNYPVNDDGMVGQLHIGPIRDRDPGLGSRARGILVNAALQPEATLVPLATWSEYLRDPVGYDPQSAFTRALEWVTGDPDDAEAVATLAAALDRSAIRQSWIAPEPQMLDRARERLATLRNRRLAEDLASFAGPG